MRVLASAVVALVLSAVCTLAQAEEPAKESRIADLELGDHWFGAKVSHDDLVGRVVLFEIWGS